MIHSSEWLNEVVDQTCEKYLQICHVGGGQQYSSIVLYSYTLTTHIILTTQQTTNIRKVTMNAFSACVICFFLLFPFQHPSLACRAFWAHCSWVHPPQYPLIWPRRGIPPARSGRFPDISTIMLVHPWYNYICHFMAHRTTIVATSLWTWPSIGSWLIGASNLTSVIALEIGVK